MKANYAAVDPLIRGSHSTTPPHAVAIRLHRLHAPEDFTAADARARWDWLKERMAWSA